MTKENSLKSNEYTLEDEYEFFVFALDVVREAGNLVKSAFAKPVGTVYTKASATDFVTETDRAVEELLIGRISSRFPDHKFIGEEGASSGKKYEFTDAPTWIIDPIDGTTNFVHRIPFLGICVGLTIKKRLCAGIVYNPITDELYYAQSGRGAFKNGFQIHTSSAKGLKEAVICQSQGIHNIREKGQEWLNLMLENQRKLILGGIHGNRSFGAASINMVFLAQGSIDAYVECGLHSWDMAAAVVIVREAGGTVIDPTGVPFDLMSRKVLCASTPELAKEFSSVLGHIDFAPEI
ncbi:Inositol-1-monophosphatase [Meloidogyne graminicola]|uniref:Inositol-1-monophosphatase n=1 Tax=Meloidogyne graminicola TaxID=189291 RepID=A0A8S9ZZ75_9BILA|nr:Inositol-1-monophosphatase [Meloidogyne graminicola]